MELTLAKAFEGLMLVCFGFSWPFNIRKTLKQRCSTGKSFMFISLVLIGYLAGIVSKLLAGADWVTLLWSLNAVMVATDLVLTAHFHRHPGGKAAAVPVAANASDDDTGIIP